MCTVLRTCMLLAIGSCATWSLGRGMEALAEGPRSAPVRPIQTDELQLVDKTGKVRATLGFLYGRNQQEKTPILRLYDHESNQVTEIEPDGLVVKSLEGSLKLRLSLYPDPGMTIYDSKGNVRAQLSDSVLGSELTLTAPGGEKVRYPK